MRTVQIRQEEVQSLWPQPTSGVKGWDWTTLGNNQSGRNGRRQLRQAKAKSNAMDDK